MKRMLAVLALAAGAALALAQTARTPPTPAQMAQHEVQRYTDLLSLTTAQQEQATTLFTDAAASEASLHTEQQSAHKALDASILTGDAATIAQSATTLGQIEGEMTSTRALAEAKFYKILNPDQQTTFASSLQRGPGRGPGHGPGRGFEHGGPDGPPPQ